MSLIQLHTFMITRQGLVLTSLAISFSGISRSGVELADLILGEGNKESACSLGLISGQELEDVLGEFFYWVL